MYIRSELDALDRITANIREITILADQKNTILAAAMVTAMDELRDKEEYEIADKLREALAKTGYRINNMSRSSAPQHRLERIA